MNTRVGLRVHLIGKITSIACTRPCGQSPALKKSGNSLNLKMRDKESFLKTYCLKVSAKLMNFM